VYLSLPIHCHSALLRWYEERIMRLPDIRRDYASHPLSRRCTPESRLVGKFCNCTLKEFQTPKWPVYYEGLFLSSFYWCHCCCPVLYSKPSALEIAERSLPSRPLFLSSRLRLGEQLRRIGTSSGYPHHILASSLQST